MPGDLFTADARVGTPYWWDDVVWPDLDDNLPESADLVVVGAGYTGLSAAIAAHDAGAQVVVMDSGRPGEGASTRNGGMLGAHPRLGWTVLAKRYGPAVADELFSEAGEALNWVKEIITRERIDCDLQTTGRIQLAYTDGQFESQRSLAGQLSEKSAVPCEIVDRDEVRREISTPLYRGGLLFPDHCGLHPSKYLLGLLNAAIRRNIVVVSNCSVTDCLPDAKGRRVTTQKGSVTAEKVILATNGYTGRQFPWHNRRVFPIPSYLIATEPLGAELISELAPGRRMMVETRAFHSYFRASPDGTRILFGGRAALVDIGLPEAARRLRRRMIQIWPQLRDVRLSHVWTGNTGFTFGQMPHVGERDGMHYSLGYSGGGTVLAPWLGRKAALQAMGSDDGRTAFSETNLSPRWFHMGGKPHFLRAINFWYNNYVDASEDRAARR